MSVHNESLFKASGIETLKKANIAVIYTRWNDFIVDELVKGCRETLQEKGFAKPIEMQVPGSVELPFACKRYYEAYKGKENAPEAIIAFGCVIRGDTPHFDYVCQAVTQGITQLNLTLPIPVLFGILTVENRDQAQERIGGTHGHKGKEAALSALQMIAFNRSLQEK